MPIEIKELLIRAFVSEKNNDSAEQVAPIIKEANNAQDMLVMVSNMIKQEKER